MTVTIGFETLRLSVTVTIRFEKLRFIGEIRSGSRRSGLSGRVAIKFPDAPVLSATSPRSGSRQLRFTGEESHDQV